MRIAFVGCGYVFDIYMRTKWAYPELEIAGVYDTDTARSLVVSEYYGLRVYDTYAALLADASVDIVVNLTSVRAHYSVTKLALESGKSVYTEKPVTTDLQQTETLFRIAQANHVVLTAAPCNVFSDAVSTVWKAVRDGAVGKPVLVYAEMDDNPAHLMSLETVRSPTGAPFPYAEELQEGCTFEHVGYQLVWLCALFGPATSVTAYSNTLIGEKTVTVLSPPDTPDFSVALLTFAEGVSARITCSWVSPRDHSFRVIGDEGEIRVDNVFHDQSPVTLERYSRVSLTARKVHSIHAQPLIGRRFNIGGRRLPLLRRWKSFAVESDKGVGRTLKHRFVSWARRRETHALDKFLGIAEMSRAMNEGREQPLSSAFLTHLNELTILIQQSGPSGIATQPKTTFQPLEPPPEVLSDRGDYLRSYRSRIAERVLPGLISRFQS